MKTKAPLTAIQKIKAIEAIGPTVVVPWTVARMISGSTKQTILIWSDDLICIGSGEADFGTLEECRQAIEWYVTQLGGEVTWK